MNDPITVIKLDASGEEVWRWEAGVVQRTPTALLLEARFNYQDAEVTFHGITLQRGDPFIEFYSSRCWYNIYEMLAHEDHHLKGWYCNVTRPAQFNGRVLTYEDLALDLLVYPDGRQLVLDEDEFDALVLPAGDRQAALAALEELQRLFREVNSFSMQTLMVSA